MLLMQKTVLSSGVMKKRVLILSDNLIIFRHLPELRPRVRLFSVEMICLSPADALYLPVLIG